jgi:uncharacterized protein (DUF2236 family)
MAALHSGVVAREAFVRTWPEWFRAVEPVLPPSPEGEGGDPGLYGPRSVVWRIARERVLLAGGAAAILLQVAHPLVAAGVAGHSDFRADPFARLRATLEPMLEIAFGDRRQAEAAAGRVGAVHDRVTGALSVPAGRFHPGTPYRARDPELAVWVHATLVATALDSYERFVEPLPSGVRARYYEETKRQAALFGAAGDVMPASYADFRRYYDGMLASLPVTDAARGIARDVLHPVVGPMVRPGNAMLRAVTAGLLSERMREQFGLAWGAAERAGFAASTLALRAAIRAMPPTSRYWPHYRVARERMRAAAPYV